VLSPKQRASRRNSSIASGVPINSGQRTPGGSLYATGTNAGWTAPDAGKSRSEDGASR
jgi:hypothetical protein